MARTTARPQVAGTLTALRGSLGGTDSRWLRDMIEGRPCLPPQSLPESAEEFELPSGPQMEAVQSLAVVPEPPPAHVESFGLQAPLLEETEPEFEGLVETVPEPVHHYELSPLAEQETAEVIETLPEQEPEITAPEPDEPVYHEPAVFVASAPCQPPSILDRARQLARRLLKGRTVPAKWAVRLAPVAGAAVLGIALAPWATPGRFRKSGVSQAAFAALARQYDAAKTDADNAKAQARQAAAERDAARKHIASLTAVMDRMAAGWDHATQAVQAHSEPVFLAPPPMPRPRRERVDPFPIQFQGLAIRPHGEQNGKQSGQKVASVKSAPLLPSAAKLPPDPFVPAR